MQERCNYVASALELYLSYSNPSMCFATVMGKKPWTTWHVLLVLSSSGGAATRLSHQGEEEEEVPYAFLLQEEGQEVSCDHGNILATILGYRDDNLALKLRSLCRCTQYNDDKNALRQLAWRLLISRWTPRCHYDSQGCLRPLWCPC